jgi:hypothetical protein
LLTLKCHGCRGHTFLAFQPVDILFLVARTDPFEDRPRCLYLESGRIPVFIGLEGLRKTEEDECSMAAPLRNDETLSDLICVQFALGD